MTSADPLSESHLRGENERARQRDRLTERERERQKQIVEREEISTKTKQAAEFDRKRETFRPTQFLGGY